LTDGQSETPWLCDISIVRKYHVTLSSKKTEKDRMHPWIETTPEIEVVASIQDKSQLLDQIRFAQEKLLQSPTGPLEFSPNVLSIKITATGFPNLSFFDLPGIVGQLRFKHDVELIDQLARTYIRKENTLVLLVLPFDQEIEKSWASGIVRDEGAEKRTLGILTKPDRLREDDPTETWQTVLAGDAFSLGHGYFVTKQPDTRTKGAVEMSWTVARHQEDAYFCSQKWMEQFPAVNKQRLGTMNLQRELSNKLGKLITKSLPGIKKHVQDELDIISLLIQGLPAPVQSPYLVLRPLVQDLSFLILVEFNVDEAKELLSAWKLAKSAFYKKLGVLQPAFLINQDPITSPEVIIVDSDGDDDVTIQSRRPAKRPRIETTSPRTLSPMSRLANGPHPTLMDLTSKYESLWTPKELHDFLEKNSGVGVPGEVSQKTMNALCVAPMRSWKEPTEELLHNLLQSIDNMKTRLRSSDVLRRWKTTKLPDHFLVCVGEVIAEEYCNLRSNVQDSLDLETCMPCVADEETYHELVKHYSKSIEDNRNEARKEESKTMPNTQLRKAEVRTPLLQKEPYERESKAMANMKAYYDLAKGRYAARVYQLVEINLFGNIRKRICSALEDKFRLQDFTSKSSV
jgi:hypothetical protein